MLAFIDVVVLSDRRSSCGLLGFVFVGSVVVVLMEVGANWGMARTVQRFNSKPAWLEDSNVRNCMLHKGFVPHATPPDRI